MIHPSTELRFINEVIGYGLVARELIPKGTITWVRCALDRQFTPAEIEALGAPYWPVIERYAYRDHRGNFVLNWDNARFMNHSCDPSVLCPGFDLDVAVRDIHPGEELTYDYAMLNLDETLQCTCGSPKCRRVVARSDIQDLADSWDRLLEPAVHGIDGVDQPLWPFLANPNPVLAAARGQIPVPSVRVHFPAPPAGAVPGPKGPRPLSN